MKTNKASDPGTGSGSGGSSSRVLDGDRDPNKRIMELVTKLGHQKTFELHGPVARRLYRATALAQKGLRLADDPDQAIAALRCLTQSMLLGVTAVRYESLLGRLPLLYMSAIAAVESEDNGMSKGQRRYAGTSLDVLLAVIRNRMTGLGLGSGSEIERQEREATPGRWKTLLDELDRLRARAREVMPAEGLPAEYDPWLYEPDLESTDGHEQTPPERDPYQRRPWHFARGLLDDSLRLWILDAVAATCTGLLGRQQGNPLQLKAMLRNAITTMLELAPNGSRGHYWRAFSAGLTKSAASASDEVSAYEKTLEHLEEDEVEAKALILYNLIYARLRCKGGCLVGSLRELYSEARRMDKLLKPLNLNTSDLVQKAAYAKKLMRSTPESDNHLRTSHSPCSPSSGGGSAPVAKRVNVADDINTCVGCKQRFFRLLLCSRCKAKYCSAACQKKHYPEHKAECRAKSQQSAAKAKPSA